MQVKMKLHPECLAMPLAPEAPSTAIFQWEAAQKELPEKLRIRPHR
jgi:hypothetical protein